MHNCPAFPAASRYDNNKETFAFLYELKNTVGGGATNNGFAPYQEHLVLEVGGTRLYVRDSNGGCGPKINPRAGTIPEEYRRATWVYCWLDPDLNPNPWEPGDTVTISLIFEYDDPEPTRPDSLYASYIGGDEVRLHCAPNATQGGMWTPSQKIERYRIELSMNGGEWIMESTAIPYESSEVWEPIVSSFIGFYTDSHLAAGTYKYRVRAASDTGDGPWRESGTVTVP